MVDVNLVFIREAKQARDTHWYIIRRYNSPRKTVVFRINSTSGVRRFFMR